MRGTNIFGNRGSQRSQDVDLNTSGHRLTLSREQRKAAFEASEAEFEQNCQLPLSQEDWSQVESLAIQQLDQTQAKSPLGFFYLGIALFKMSLFKNSIKAFERCY